MNKKNEDARRVVENDALFDDVEVDVSHVPLGGVRRDSVPVNHKYPTWTSADFAMLGLSDIMRGVRPIIPHPGPTGRNETERERQSAMRRPRFGARTGKVRNWRGVVTRTWTIEGIENREHHYIFERVVSYLDSEGIRRVGQSGLPHEAVVAILQGQGYTLIETLDFYGEQIEVFQRPGE